jgi:hypothetical protein
VTNSTVSGNTASGITAGQGGGLANAGGTVTVTNSTGFSLTFGEAACLRRHVGGGA